MIINEFKQFLFANISNIYDNSNSIIALDSICLKYENLCKFNFEYLLNYYFKQYIKELNINKQIEFSDLITNLLFEIINTNNLFVNINEFCYKKRNRN